MTDREICEQIVRLGYCYGISCKGAAWYPNEGHRCPLESGEWDCIKFERIRDAAEAWLRDHDVENQSIGGEESES